MAPLIEAARVRLASLELRHTLRANNPLARAITEIAAAAAVARRNIRRTMICVSPWSGLEWRGADEQLGRVLAPVD